MKCLVFEKWKYRGDNEVPGERETSQEYLEKPDAFHRNSRNNHRKFQCNNYLIFFARVIFHLDSMFCFGFFFVSKYGNSSAEMILNLIFAQQKVK